MQELPEPNDVRRPLWRWLLLAIAPGLVCDVLGAICLLVNDAKPNDVGSIMILPMLAAPLVGLVYLIVLGRRYVRAGMGTSVATFVIGCGLLNTLLWGAGCAMQLSTMRFAG